MLRVFIVLTAATALAACASKSADDEAAEKAAAQAQAAPARKTVLDPQLKALQKAKDVQKVLDDGAKATDKAIDDSGG